MKYALVIVDDFSRYTSVLFIAHKDEIFKVFKKFRYGVKKQTKKIVKVF